MLIQVLEILQKMVYMPISTIILINLLFTNENY